MSHLALYRKYRPKNFDEISGQSAIVQTLRNQIRTGRIGHAYLFYGLRGSGKTSIARIFAKAVNCEHTVDGNPCNQCCHCTYQNDVNPDIIEIDAASNNGVDSTRQLIDEVNYKPTNTKYKIYIIDEVHMLSNSAFNALLKTVEEPPEHAIFILATTELHKVPTTIKSRCQLYNFKLIDTQDIISSLKNILQQENVTYFDDTCLEYIARKGEGSMRDAISVLDQCIAQHMDNSPATVQELKQLFGDIDDEVINEMTSCIENADIPRGIEIIRRQYQDGRSLKSFFNALYQHYFTNLVNQFGTNDAVLYERYGRILGETIMDFDRSSQKVTVAEIAFIKMCKPEMERDYNSVVQRMNNLERELMQLKSGTSVPMQPDNAQSNQEYVDENVILYYNSACGNETIIL